METLLSKLEKEAGLTSEQAAKAVACFKQYMKENDLQIDWEAFLKAKSQQVTEKAQGAFNQLFGDSDWADKASASLNEFAEKTKKTIKDVRNKTADFIADK